MNPRFPSSTAISCRTPASRVPAPEASAARLPGARGPAAGILLAVLVGAAAVFAAGDFTRGVGIYPGDPAAFHGPVLVPDTTTYRNLALHRPATASSNYDYNLTAQLITDGIIDQRLPRWLVCSSSAEGILPRDKREHLVDAYPGTAIDLPAAGGWVQVEQAGRYDAPGVDRIDVIAMVRSEDKNPQRWTCAVEASDDGRTWRELGRTGAAEVLATDSPWRPSLVKASFDIPAGGTARFYRARLDAPSVTGWRVASLDTFARGRRVNLGGPHDFVSAWKSAGSGAEWVQVDLGAACTFDRVALHWIRRAAEGEIQVIRRRDGVADAPAACVRRRRLCAEPARDRALRAGADDASRKRRRRLHLERVAGVWPRRSRPPGAGRPRPRAPANARISSAARGASSAIRWCRWTAGRFPNPGRTAGTGCRPRSRGRRW